MFNFALRPLAAALHAQRWSLALASAVIPGLAFAAPSGGQVVAGQASIGTPTPGNTVIDQTSHSAVINWQQFSVGSSEYVVFNQPSASATMLNRVVGGSPSEILGNISANGRVFLINPSGVLFGQGARVDVGSLVASSLNISDNDFMQGRYVLAGTSGAGVSNAGHITAAEGGFVVLAGDKVDNSGLIQAQLGKVALASGSAVTLGLDAQGLIDFSIDGAALSAAAGVNNVGDIIADGGSVIMSARVAQALVGNAVNNSGTVQARSIGEREGAIYLLAEGGDIRHDGMIDVSGDAQANGGTVRIAGDGDITLTGNSTTLAHGKGGGEVAVIAEDTMVYAKGAEMDVGARQQGARGGYVEFSGHENLQIRDTVALGHGGRLTLDPSVFTIGSNGTIEELTLEQLLRDNFSGSVVEVVASNEIRLLNLADGVLDGTTADSSYGAGLALRIGSCQASAADGTCAGGFTPGEDGSISFDDVNDKILVDGAIIIETGNRGSATPLGSVNVGSLTSREEFVSIFSTGNIAAKNITAGGSDVSITSTHGGITTGAINISSSTLFLVEGSFGYLEAGISLAARDGIQTGDLTIDLSAPDQGLARTFVTGSIDLTANAFPGNGGDDDFAIQTGNIRIDADAAGSFGGVTAGASLVIDNGAPNAETSVITEGGNLTTGSITLNARGTAASSTNCQQTQDCTTAIAGAEIFAGGNVSTQDISLNASGATSNTAAASIDSYNRGSGGNITLGNIVMSANSSVLSVFASPDIDPDPNVTSPTGNLTMGRVEGVNSISLKASNNLTMNAGSAAIVSPNSVVLLEAGNLATLRGQSLQFSGSLSAGRLVIETNGDVVAQSASIDAGGLSIRGRNIDLHTASVSVGNEVMALGADPNLLSKLPSELRPDSTGPNAAFEASGSLQIGSMVMDGDYLFIRSSNTSLGSVTRVSEGGDTIFFNNRPFANTDALLVTTDNVVLPPGSTYVFGGSGYSGDINISLALQGALADLAPTAKAPTSTDNFLFATQGRVNGKDQLSTFTSGQVLVLEGIVSGGETPQEEMIEEADSAQNAVSQMELPQTETMIAGIEIAEASPVEEVTDSPDEKLECR